MTTIRGKLVCALAAAVLAGGAWVVAGPAQPAGAVTVSTEAELRTAFGDASETTITLAGDITLTDCTGGGGDVDRSSSTALVLDGAGHAVTQTCAGERVFEQTGTGTATFTDVTVTGGDLSTGAFDAHGGGIRAVGSVVLDDATVTANTAAGDDPHGGGVWSGGDITVTDSTVSANHADGTGAGEGWGGGVYTDAGTITITGSTLSGNTTTGTLAMGGAFFTLSGGASVTTSTISGNSVQGDIARFGGAGTLGPSLTVTASTVTGNTADGGGAGQGTGGGIGGASVSVTNSTITGNQATGATTEGGGIFGGDVTLVYATVVSNSAAVGANVAVADGSPTLLTTYGSVLALPLVGANCALDGSTTATQGDNFSDDSSCELVTWGDWQDGGDPQLGALADNGGPTETRIPLATSPLIDRIPTDRCQLGTVTTDQRGFPRTGVPACDVGAVEFQPTMVSSETEFRARFADTAERSIGLAADISIEDCTEVLRDSTTPITIVGNGHSITQTCTFRVITQAGTGTLTLADVTIAGGAAQGGDVYARGGGVQGVGDVIIDRATITGNQLTQLDDGNTANDVQGGGVFAGGTLLVTDSVISANQIVCTSTQNGNGCESRGGGLYSVGDMTITRSTVQGNSAQAPGNVFFLPEATGGGFYTDEGDVTIDTSSILDNAVSAGSEARGGGGGSGDGSISVTASTVARNAATDADEAGAGGLVAGDSVLLVNSTVSANSADGNAGGILAGSLTLVYATVSRNVAPSGANVGQHVGEPLVITAFASVIGVPLGGGENCEVGGASPVDHGSNFVDDASCGFAVTGDLRLGTLGAHGGPTLTEVPLAGSPLIDAVGVVDCQADGATGITTDQRNFPRPAPGAGCDAGAVEVQLADSELPGSTPPGSEDPLAGRPDPTFTG